MDKKRHEDTKNDFDAALEGLEDTLNELDEIPKERRPRHVMAEWLKNHPVLH